LAFARGRQQADEATRLRYGYAAARRYSPNGSN
jgi:hypothetical protein